MQTEVYKHVVEKCGYELYRCQSFKEILYCCYPGHYKYYFAKFDPRDKSLTLGYNICRYFDNELSPRDFKTFNHGEITGKEFEETLIKLKKEYKAEMEKEKLDRIQEDFL